MTQTACAWLVMLLAWFLFGVWLGSVIDPDDDDDIERAL